MAKRPRRGPSKDAQSRKDRLIQTRVPRGLESALKAEAERRRLSVSHLIRNVLEDTFDLVDHVVSEVDSLVSDTVGLAKRVQQDAKRVAQTARQRDDRPRSSRGAKRAEGASGDDALAQPYAWNEVVLNRPAHCARCGRSMTRGTKAYLGMGPDPSAAPTWLCGVCVAAL
ncbi:MAG: hypothetical protein ACHQ53_02545 [Polyangiales bacterium]